MILLKSYCFQCMQYINMQSISIIIEDGTIKYKVFCPICKQKYKLIHGK